MTGLLGMACTTGEPCHHANTPDHGAMGTVIALVFVFVLICALLILSARFGRARRAS